MKFANFSVWDPGSSWDGDNNIVEENILYRYCSTHYSSGSSILYIKLGT